MTFTFGLGTLWRSLGPSRSTRSKASKPSGDPRKDLCQIYVREDQNDIAQYMCYRALLIYTSSRFYISRTRPHPRLYAIKAPPTTAATPARTACCVILGTPAVLLFVLAGLPAVALGDAFPVVCVGLPVELEPVPVPEAVLPEPPDSLSKPAVMVTGITRELRPDQALVATVIPPPALEPFWYCDRAVSVHVAVSLSMLQYISSA